MKSMKKTVKLFVDLLPLAKKEDEPMGFVSFARLAQKQGSGYNRFEISGEFDCPMEGEKMNLNVVEIRDLQFEVEPHKFSFQQEGELEFLRCRVRELETVHKHEALRINAALGDDLKRTIEPWSVDVTIAILRLKKDMRGLALLGRCVDPDEGEKVE